MQVTFAAPSAPLAAYVRRFTVVETRDEGATRALLPEAGLILGIRFGGAATLLRGGAAIRMPDASLAGFVGAVRHMQTSPGGGVVLATFREAGAARFFAEPLHELTGQTIALGDVVRRAELSALTGAIGDAPDHAHRIARLEAFLLARLRPEAPDPLVDAAVAAIRRARGALRISALADELGISHDPLEKRFRRAVGASPKQLASLLRLRSVLDARAAAGDRARVDVSWSRLALAAGYFDQSHFNREFRAVTGASPARFFRPDAFC